MFVFQVGYVIPARFVGFDRVLTQGHQEVHSDVLLGRKSFSLEVSTASFLALPETAETPSSQGVQAKNVFWVINGALTTGADSVLHGIFLTNAAATIAAGNTLHGRLLAQNAITIAAT
mgnify:FL=1